MSQTLWNETLQISLFQSHFLSASSPARTAREASSWKIICLACRQQIKAHPQLVSVCGFVCVWSRKVRANKTTCRARVSTLCVSACVWISELSGDAWGRPKHQRGPALILSLLHGPSYLSRAGGSFHGQPTNCVCMSLIPVDVQALGTERDGEDASPVEIIVWPLNIMSKPR